jgi:hypothetical protein
VSKFRIWSRFAAVIALLSVASAAPAQVMSKSDEALLKAKLTAAHKARLDTLPIASRVIAFGKMFLGTPYVAGTLDVNPATEKLTHNLHGLDCVTFYETSLALARARSLQPADFYKQLELLRYRNGKINGYPSRLHYTTDYFYDAEKKGVLKNVTKEAGDFFVSHDDRPVNFMSEHRSSYKQLADDKNFAAIKAVEADMASRGGFDYIPKNKIFLMEPKIKSGDILGITTDIPGLDVSHTGIAVRENGHIHFMHASSAQGKVIISEDPLAEYMKNNTHQTGIIIMRPEEVVKAKAKK